MNPTLITILGPTATGKTALAANLAYNLGGEVISADSRQVYRGMDIGTGKDLSDYTIGQTTVPHHLIDICHPEEEYNAYRFIGDFVQAFNDITQRDRQPILCGGTGLYIDAVVRGYRLPDAPIDPSFRASLEPYTDEQLTQRLAKLVPLHNHTDTETRQRLIRALEIAEYRLAHPDSYTHLPPMQHRVFGIEYPRSEIIERIGIRLSQRLDQGMVQEVQHLISEGISPERLMRFGLEYRHITLYITGRCTEQQMFDNLFTDIRRFAKRQMTWFRRMQRCGVEIDWIDGHLPLSEKIDHITSRLAKA